MLDPTVAFSQASRYYNSILREGLLKNGAFGRVLVGITRRAP